MVGQSLYQLFRYDIEGLADTQHRDQRNRPSRLNHLPVANTESARDHVLLGQLALHSVRPYAVPQGTKVPAVLRRDFSAGTHPSKLPPQRARTPRTNLRVGARRCITVRLVIPSKAKRS